MAIDEDENEPYTRWQGFRINQLGLCISLFLTFAVATLGFSINLLTQQTFPITACFAKVFFFFSPVFGLLSVVFGSAACVTRLNDFRTTAKVARHRGDKNYEEQVARWREEYKEYGRWTWGLFWVQLSTFGLQVIALILALGITYWQRLM